jgi:hypothetical protein
LIMGRSPGRGAGRGGGTSGRGPGAGVATGTSAVRERCCARAWRNKMYSRLISGTVNGIRPGSSGGGWPARVGTGGAGLVSRKLAAVTAQIARAAMTRVRCRMTGAYRRTWAWS